jgi:hypothetical protein
MTIFKTNDPESKKKTFIFMQPGRYTPVQISALICVALRAFTTRAKIQVLVRQKNKRKAFTFLLRTLQYLKTTTTPHSSFLLTKTSAYDGKTFFYQ